MSNRSGGRSPFQSVARHAPPEGVGQDDTIRLQGKTFPKCARLPVHPAVLMVPYRPLGPKSHMFKGHLSGPPLISALDAEIIRTSGEIARQLAPYDPIVTPQCWHRILQGAEELINLATEPLDDDGLHHAIVDMPLRMAVGLRAGWLGDAIKGLFDGGIETRILEVLRLLHAFDSACAANGLQLGLDTVGAAAGYLHTRRRRIVALLYVMPQLCRGKIEARTSYDLVPFVTLVEQAFGPLIDLSQMRMLAYLSQDYEVESDGVRYRATRTADLLDEGAMDPERVSVLDMLHHGVVGDFPTSDHLDPRRLLSKAEVVHQIALIEIAYAEFDLAGTSFAAVRELLLPLLRGPQAHVVTAPAEPFLAAVEHYARLWPALSRATFVHEGFDPAGAINGHQPFIRIGDQLVTNVTLVTRFLNDWKNRVLDRRKRFQIRSGFIFEKKVRQILEAVGFAPTPVRRIERKEFDVVMTRDGAIHNFQCKNTSIDNRLIEGQPARYARYNIAVVKSHRRALAKEFGREHLLKDKLGLPTIHHYVISRFPVICDDPDIIPFAHMKAWSASLR